MPSLPAREVQNGLKHFPMTGFGQSDLLFNGVGRCFTKYESISMESPCLQVGLSFRGIRHSPGSFPPRSKPNPIRLVAIIPEQ